MDMQLLESAFVAVGKAVDLEAIDMALILGSGWSDVAEAFEPLEELPYSAIPAMGAPGVAGHRGRLLIVRAGSRRILIFQGRRHWYEGLGWTPVALPVYIAIKAGARAALITNAAGGIHPEFAPGDLMLITDHINAIGTNPLVGAHSPLWGERFPDQSRLYDPELKIQLRQSAAATGVALREGVYLATSGPCYETPAEVRVFRGMGADAVGMSTVPESILAGAAGLRVAAVSCITNAAAGMAGAPLAHAEVLDSTQKAMPAMRSLLHHAVTHARL